MIRPSMEAYPAQRGSFLHCGLDRGNRIIPFASVEARIPCPHLRIQHRREGHASHARLMLRTLMHPYPHSYVAAARAEPAGLVATESPGLETLHTAPPAQFDGPGNRWSPETLLIASIADCFVLTFRAVSRAARFPWLDVECRVEGELEI